MDRNTLKVLVDCLEHIRWSAGVEDAGDFVLDAIELGERLEADMDCRTTLEFLIDLIEDIERVRGPQNVRDFLRGLMR